MRTIVRNLRDTDRFRLAGIDVGLRSLDQDWNVPGTLAARLVLDRFADEFFLGGADLATCFDDAARLIATAPSDRRHIVIYVGDAQDTFRPQERLSVATESVEGFRAAKAAFYSVLLDDDAPGRNVAESLAAGTGAAVFTLSGHPDDDQALFRWLLAGLPSPARIVSIHVSGVEHDDLFYPSSWQPGSTLPVSGRMPKPDNLHLTITTEIAGSQTTRQIELPFSKAGDDTFVGRLWAQQRLDRLRRGWEPTPSGARDPRGQQIVRLSQEWSLLSPLTAFLVLENEREYANWNIDRRARRRYWKPAEATRPQALPVDWLARVQTMAKTNPAEDLAFVEKIIGKATEAITDGDPDSVTRIAQTNSRFFLDHRREDYTRLLTTARQMIMRRTVMQALGNERALVDPAAMLNPDHLELSLLSLAGITNRGPFAAQHPHAQFLLRKVPAPTGPVSLTKLCELLRQATGANVVLDTKALEDAGIALDSESRFFGFGELPLRGLAPS